VMSQPRISQQKPIMSLPQCKYTTTQTCVGSTAPIFLSESEKSASLWLPPQRLHFKYGFARNYNYSRLEIKETAFRDIVKKLTIYRELTVCMTAAVQGGGGGAQVCAATDSAIFKSFTLKPKMNFPHSTKHNSIIGLSSCFIRYHS
jgi:hypothetical protein